MMILIVVCIYLPVTYNASYRSQINTSMIEGVEHFTNVTDGGVQVKYAYYPFFCNKQNKRKSEFKIHMKFI